MKETKPFNFAVGVGVKGDCFPIPVDGRENALKWTAFILFYTDILKFLVSRRGRFLGVGNQKNCKLTKKPSVAVKHFYPRRKQKTWFKRFKQQESVICMTAGQLNRLKYSKKSTVSQECVTYLGVYSEHTNKTYFLFTLICVAWLALWYINMAQTHALQRYWSQNSHNQLARVWYKSHKTGLATQQVVWEKNKLTWYLWDWSEQLSNLFDSKWPVWRK